MYIYISIRAKHMSTKIKYDMKTVATMAHRLRKMTGCSFSLAMRTAWGRHKEQLLRELLKTFGSVQFVYQKIDGSLRPATGTKKNGKLTEYKAQPNGTGTSSPKVVTYFDSGANAWRSFRRGHLVKITGVVQ